MNISNIKYFCTVNGTGVRTAVFVSGCRFNCPGCFNPEAHDFNYGQPLNNELIDKILDSIDYEYISGLSILGGEPLVPENQDGVYKLIRKFRERFGNNKTIWVWTGYTYEKIPLSPNGLGILKEIDVLVDGLFVASKKDLSLPYRGSSNQRIIDMKKTFQNHKVIELDVE